MIMKKTLKILAVFSFMTSVSYAGPFVEPQMGYVLGSYTDSSGATGSANGLGFGAQLGSDFLEIFYVAADFHYSMPSIAPSSASVTTSASHWALGATFGLTVPAVGLIFRFGYYFIDKLSYSTSTYSGNAFKFGLGYKILPFLTANVDYLIHSLGTLDVSGSSTTLATPFKDNVWMISLSSPLVIPF